MNHDDARAVAGTILGQDDLTSLKETRPAFTTNAERTSAAFYETLFRQAPGLRAMFPADLSDQGRKLCAMITAAINAAGDMETLAPVLAELARRHVAYGVTEGHYALVGRALLTTLEDLGASPSQVRAWAKTYGVLSKVMIDAAYPARAASVGSETVADAAHGADPAR